MRRLTLTLDEATAQRLTQVAEQQRRRPQDQAIVCLETGLRAESAPPAQAQEVTRDDRVAV